MQLGEEHCEQEVEEDVAEVSTAGKGAKYTRAHPPECVLGSRSYPDRAAASRAEHALKRQPKARKLAWLLAAADAASAG